MKCGHSRERHYNEGDFHFHPEGQKEHDQTNDSADNERDGPDETGRGPGNLAYAGRVFCDLANHHSRQAGIGNKLSNHGKSQHPLVLAKFR